MRQDTPGHDRLQGQVRVKVCVQTRMTTQGDPITMLTLSAGSGDTDATAGAKEGNVEG